MTPVNPATLAACATAAEKRLRDAGIDAPQLDARLLVAAALGLDANALCLAPKRTLSAAETQRIEEFLARRIDAREPVSRILGRREFWSLEFQVAPAVLDPRPDSETLVETALALFPAKNAPLRVLDLGTGSGCLLLAVLHERRLASGIGVDVSAAALEIALENAARLGLAARARFVRDDWGGGLAERFDLILCNPPYVGEGEHRSLPPEVARHDPPSALFAGPDGLGAHRAILPSVPRLLSSGGYALFEIGATQGAAVSDLARAAGLQVVAIKPDLAGCDRCLVTASG